MNKQKRWLAEIAISPMSGASIRAIRRALRDAGISADVMTVERSGRRIDTITLYAAFPKLKRNWRAKGSL